MGFAKRPCIQQVYSQGFRHNPLVYEIDIHKGSQWVVFIPTHVNADVHKGARCV